MTWEKFWDWVTKTGNLGKAAPVVVAVLGANWGVLHWLVGHWRSAPPWIAPWLPVAIISIGYLLHVLVFSKRLRAAKVEVAAALEQQRQVEYLLRSSKDASDRAVELRDEVTKERDKLKEKLKRTAKELDAFVREVSPGTWAPSSAVFVELWTGNDHFVSVHDGHASVLAIVRFLNVAPFPVTVAHANLKWIVERDNVTVSTGAFKEPPTLGPLLHGHPQKLTIHEGKADLQAPLESCAVLMTLSGYVTLQADGWDGNQKLEVSHWIWVSLLDKRVKLPDVSILKNPLLPDQYPGEEAGHDGRPLAPRTKREATHGSRQAPTALTVPKIVDGAVVITVATHTTAKPSNELLSVAMSVKNMLVARATGSQGGEDVVYQDLRAQLIGHSSVKDVLPECVRTCRTIAEFWGYIQPKLSTYPERREYLRKEFEPLLAMLEAGSEETP